jgi:iron complex outermembrane recepter protein
MKCDVFWSIAAFIVLFLSCNATTLAADADSPDPSVTTLEKITITAQKRDEDSQDVGIALSVLPGSSLPDRAVSNVNDLQYSTPSLEVEPAFGSSQAEFRLRGVGFVDYMANNSSPVEVTVDGVAYAFPIQTQGLLFDLDRVEVLRGPQGTLYGLNTTGGAINFVTNQPTAQTHAGFRVDYGNDDALNAEGYLSGALSDDLRGRLSIAVAQGGAWQHNRLTGQSLGDNDNIALRAQLDWDALPWLNLHGSVHSAVDKSDEEGLYLFSPFQPSGGEPVIPADTNHSATGWGLRPEFAALVGLSPDARPSRNNRNDGADMRAVADLGSMQLTSISAINTMLRREYGDYDASQYAESDQFFRSWVNTLSQELRLQSTATDPLSWLTGLYWSHDVLNEKSYEDFADRLGGDLLTEYRQTGESLGLFGQTDYRFNDYWKASLGLRYEHETRDIDDFFTRFIDPPIVFVGPVDRSLSSSAPSGKIAVEYTPQTATLFYASISRGVKSGGFTAHNATDATAINIFQPEVLIAYETGFKTDIAPTLRLNGALFHYNYHDQQVLVALLEPLSQSLIGSFVNAPRSEIDGGELELTWQPTAGIHIGQYLGYKSGKYTSSFVTYDSQASLAAGHDVFIDYNGKDLSFPKLSYGGSVAWTFDFGNCAITADTNYSYRDSYDQLLLLGSGYTLDSYWLANANLTLKLHGSAWSFGLWGHNIFDTRYDLTRNFFLPGTDVAAAGRPISYGIRVSYSY